MKKNRRDFFKLGGLAGLSLAGSSIVQGFSGGSKASREANGHCSAKFADQQHIQQFNMSGFAAPKLDVVRIGFIGVGARGE
jgi:hypothetical protein